MFRYLPESCVLIIVGIVIGLIIYSGSEYDHRIKGSEDHENRIVLDCVKKSYQVKSIKH